MRERLNQTRIVKWLERWSPVLFLPLAIGTLLGITISIVALVRINVESAHQNRALSEIVKQQNETVQRQKYGTCAFAYAVGQLRPKSIPVQSPGGNGITDNIQDIVTATKVMQQTYECDKPSTETK
jgi:hypothetical protein